ncbi:MAG: riboflavin synthase [Candidatus Binatia bacterium]
MFSGIVEAIGSIRSVSESGEGKRFAIAARFADLALGESVCVSGVCLTVVGNEPGSFDVEVSCETLRRSKLGRLGPGHQVNLERSIRLSDRLSGHLVFGHVDGVGKLLSLTPEGDSQLYRFEPTEAVARYLVEKGSVSVDGVSLTVFECSDRSFTVAVIPHTARVTTLGSLKPGDPVNLESDMIAKYVEKFVSELAERRR